MSSNIKRFTVDFTKIEDGAVKAVVDPKAHIGEVVAAVDTQGNYCLGEITSIAAEHLLISLHQSTWRSAGEQPDFLDEIIEERAADSPGFLNALDAAVRSRSHSTLS